MVGAEQICCRSLLLVFGYDLKKQTKNHKLLTVLNIVVKCLIVFSGWNLFPFVFLMLSGCF